MCALLALALPIASRAQDAPATGSEPASETPAESEPVETPEQELPPAGEEMPLPEGVEVIRIQGETVKALEQEATTSVTQFDAEALQALGAQNVGDLAKVTPNLEIKTAGATAPTFFIRGVGLSDFAANAAGAVAIYQDDVPRNAPAIQLGTLFDIENVVVLRGPQGSGSGRNASAGAIKVYSKEPTGELEAWLRSSFGNFGLQDYEGAIETPLVDEILSSRFAFRFSERDPIASNRCDQLQDNIGIDTGFDPPPGTIGRTVPPLTERVADPNAWNNISFCGEARFVSFRNPDPPPDQYGPFGGGQALSPLPGGLEGDVNDMGNWAARGIVRLQPPATDLDVIFNMHGGRRDELSTLGQAIGTQGIGGSATDPGIFGNSVATSGGYRDRDIIAMQSELEQEFGVTPGSGLQDPRVVAELERKLAENLDKHPFRGDYNRVGDTTLDTWGGLVDAEWDLGWLRLKSISGYDTYDRYRDTDQDFTPQILFESIQKDEGWQFTQDLGADGEFTDASLRWNFGGFYLMEHIDYFADQLARQPNAQGNPLTLLLDYTQDLWSWGTYAGFSWDFANDFTLEGGARYNWEQKDFDYSLDALGVTSLVEESEIWQAPTGTLALTYRFRDDTSAYWKYARGWKGGHFNALPQTTLGATVAEPESIDAFETGLNGSWFDGRFGAHASLFYYDYQDYQVLVVQDSAAGPPGIAIINANDAEVYGGELELRAEPLDALVLTGRLGWLESQFLDFTNQVVRTVVGSDGQAVPRVVTIDYTGNQLINSPKFKASGGVDYTFDMGRYGSLLPRYDFAWTDDIFFDPSEGRGSPNALNQVFLPEYATGQKAYWLHNIRMGYRTADGKIELAGWVRNLTDEVYKSYGFDASSFSKVVINYVGEPRTYGLDFILHF